MPQTPQEYIERRVDKINGCWIWKLQKNKDGVGLCYYRYHTYQAPRLAFETYIGELDKDMQVRQTCGNPACCNPEHLFLIYKPQHDYPVKVYTGEDHHHAKYSNELVEQARMLHKDGLTPKEIAQQTGIKVEALYDMLAGKSRISTSRNSD